MTQASKLAQIGSPGVSTGFKNRIINGAMMIDQRNAGASVTASATATYTYTLDRWAYLAVAANKFTIQQNAGSVTPPVGFTNYLGVTSSAATSVGSGDYYLLKQGIEGFNIADLGWGTANAKTVTLSFQVYSSLTGTFGGSLQNNAQNRSYPFTYTISSANTWTTISITVAGDTSGAWLTNNGQGIRLHFGLGLGSTYVASAGAWAAGEFYSATGATSVVGTNGATFYITGVQLEVGTTATDFEYRDYGRELMMCQRYAFTVSGIPSASYARKPIFGNGTNTAIWYPQYPVPMRTQPTLTAVSITSSSLEAFNYSSSAGIGNITNATMAEGDYLVGQVTLTFASGISSGQVASWRWTGGATSANYFLFNAEL